MNQKIEEKPSVEETSPVEGDSNTEQKHSRLEVRYDKSSGFRVVRADGVYGGVLPNLNIHMSFFVERGPVPNKVSYVVSQGGKLEGEAAIDIEGGVVREVETTVVMDLSVARSFLDWLKEKVDLGDAVQRGTAKKEEDDATSLRDGFEQP